MTLRGKTQRIAGLILASAVSYKPIEWIYHYLIAPSGSLPLWQSWWYGVLTGMLGLLWFVFIGYALSKEKEQ